MKRRQAGGLHRVLGTAALFSTAYGNVGSSIYYALGLVTVYALGLTPIAFLISGAIFFFTAVTYAEATARFPEAGGSSSFTRHAFNESGVVLRRLGADAELHGDDRDLGDLRAALPGQVLARPAPDRPPGGHLRRRRRRALLVLLNIVGVKEAAGLNIFLALADLGTQALLVVIGLVTVFSPTCCRRTCTSARRRPGATSSSPIPVAMVAYTGIETISNMAEEAIDPPRHVPRSIMYVVLAVFAIYAFLPSVALSALPVQARDAGRWSPTRTARCSRARRR